MKHLLLATLALCAAAPVHAATVVDVNNLVTGTPVGGASASSIPSAGYNAYLYQSFTVGTTGYLSSIDLFGGTEGTGNVYVQLYRGGSTSTVGTELLATVQRASSTVVDYGVTSFDFRSFDIFATAGDTLTFKMSVDPCGAGESNATCYRTFTNWYSFQGGVSSTNYAGGSGFLQLGENGALNSSYGDLNFRTQVDTVVAGAVPEPASWAMMIGGFGVVGGALRRTRRRTLRVAAA